MDLEGLYSIDKEENLLSFYELTRNPFIDTFTTNVYVPRQGFEIYNLAQLVCQGGAIGLLTGPLGSGKTFELVMLEKYLAKEYEKWREINKEAFKWDKVLPIYIDVGTVKQISFLLTTIAREINKIEDREVISSTNDLYLLEDSIIHFLRKENIRLILLINEIQYVNPEILDYLRALSEPNVQAVGILACGPRKLVEKKLGERTTGHQPLGRRVVGEVTLNPLTFDQTKELIEKRLEWADNGISFNEEITELIHNFSGGFPAISISICRKSLEIAFLNKEKTIERNTVIEAYNTIRGLLKMRGASDVLTTEGIHPLEQLINIEILYPYPPLQQEIIKSIWVLKEATCKKILEHFDPKVQEYSKKEYRNRYQSVKKQINKLKKKNDIEIVRAVSRGAFLYRLSARMQTLLATG